MLSIGLPGTAPKEITWEKFSTQQFQPFAGLLHCGGSSYDRPRGQVCPGGHWKGKEWGYGKDEQRDSGNQQASTLSVYYAFTCILFIANLHSISKKEI